MGNLTYKEAIEIFKSVLEHCKKELQKTPWPSEQFDKVLLQSSAVELAIAAMISKDPLPPVQNEEGEWRCAICGCNVDFDIMPGIKGDFCGHCGKGIDWLSVQRQQRAPELLKQPQNGQDDALNTNTIGERIKAIRMKNKLTQTELANLLNKKLRTVQKYESGEIVPSFEMINQLAAALNTIPAILLGYESF